MQITLDVINLQRRQFNNLNINLYHIIIFHLSVPTSLIIVFKYFEHSVHVIQPVLVLLCTREIPNQQCGYYCTTTIPHYLKSVGHESRLLKVENQLSMNTNHIGGDGSQLVAMQVCFPFLRPFILFRKPVTDCLTFHI